MEQRSNYNWFWYRLLVWTGLVILMFALWENKNHPFDKPVNKSVTPSGLSVELPEIKKI